ncbi:MBL fold metallo-hydrolase [Coriobacteriales bacterium OH1046]|nr:MBL fold metallo-hydrolase [Coriobacteriales bacterium OH1046]
MRIAHIYHSGMLVELDGAVLVFDWYCGELPAFDHGKLVICFVSHDHRDHYGPRIWGLAESCPNIHYVLDDALRAQRRLHDGLDIRIVTHGDDLELGGARMRAIESNDAGVAFLVEAEGRTIYHSGDLNVWWWDRALEANEASDAFFRRAVAGLGVHDVDAAFLPLDPRLRDPTRGVVAFMEEVGAELVIPMHYGDEQEKAMAHLDAAALAPYRDRICFDDVIEVR